MIIKTGPKIYLISLLLFSSIICEEPLEERNMAVDVEEQIQEIKRDVKKPDDRAIFIFGGGKNRVISGFKFRPEAFYSRSLQLFSPSKLDQVIYAQATFDVKTEVILGKSLKSMLTIRHKSIWGDPNTIAKTTKNPVKIAGDVLGDHNHFLGKQVFWMREGWVDISLNDAFSFESCNRHYLTVGAFSFKIGRGISLGDAYAVTPGLLGFYSNNVVDQYAYGVLSHGDFVKDWLNYDFYISILEDLSDNFENVNEKIYDMEIGKRRTMGASRGFGKLNYIIAGRLIATLLHPEKNCGRKLTLEPYLIFNKNPEQDVEFPSDAKSHLFTPGLAFEFESPKWEFGFEIARNFGAQNLRAWDRNRLEAQRNADTAALNFVYSDIRTQDPVGNPGAPKALVTKTNKTIVDDSQQGVQYNGKQISANPVLYNDINRFRPCYSNKYLGWMFVTDAAYKFSDKLKLAGTFAYATGDEDPNVDLDSPLDSEVDGNYKGFIGLQEIYSGKRVQSLFVLNKSISRPLSVPSNDIPEEDPFSQNVNGFTNLVYFGFGLDWIVNLKDKKFSIKPNILAYWMQHPAKAFDSAEGITINRFASKFLGTELNTWTEVKLLDNLKGFLVAGVFFPGQHYQDVRGKPLNKAQIDILNERNDTGIENLAIPVLGTHVAAILNWGFEYVF